MPGKIKSICVNCASSPGAQPEYLEASRALGKVLAQQGLTLVYGGANVGLMGEVADAVLNNGGRVVGVITEKLNEKVGHQGLQELHVVSTMHERKTKMFELSDGFIAMPGGIGTLEEVTEVLTWAQLGLHTKPVGFLNIRAYYDPLMKFLDHAVNERFLRSENMRMILMSPDPVQLLVEMEAYVPSPVEKWMDRR
jgi:uncharacterized protein (TIGR00730 family)